MKKNFRGKESSKLHLHLQCITKKVLKLNITVIETKNKEKFYLNKIFEKHIVNSFLEKKKNNKKHQTKKTEKNEM